MKLRDLDAQFLGNVNAAEKSAMMQDSIDGAQAVLFQCPKCAIGKETGEKDGRRFVRGAHHVKVCFANPRGAPVAPVEYDDNPRWTMEGTSLDDLTLSPSINLDVPENGVDSCKWHGWVKNGDAT